jgi:PncC family amidohydrolase
MSVQKLAKLLMARELKIVFAESCTGGLVAGALTRVPGISAYHCGGVVVYRNETKTAYLGISPRVLKTHDAVSAFVARLMAERVLERTPEADLALSVTGHLGPQAPPKLDGVVFIGLAIREREKSNLTISTAVQRFDCPPNLNRTQRQRLVVRQVLQAASDYLSQS